MHMIKLPCVKLRGIIFIARQHANALSTILLSQTCLSVCLSVCPMSTLCLNEQI